MWEKFGDCKNVIIISDFSNYFEWKFVELLEMLFFGTLVVLNNEHITDVSKSVQR